MAATTMNPFSDLPYELLSMINEYAADWVSLESLIHMSPPVATLFHPGDNPDAEADPEAVRLVETILSTNPIMSHRIHIHFRMCAQARQLSLTRGALRDLDTYDYDSIHFSPISRSILREMVGVAANIQRLVCVCLTSLFARLRAVKPQCWDRDDTGRLDRSSMFTPQDRGAGSWVEEYRVYRALWLLQWSADSQCACTQLKQERRTTRKQGHYLCQEAYAVFKCLQSIYQDSTRFGSLSNSYSLNAMPRITQMPDASNIPFKFPVWAPPPRPEIPCNTDIWLRGASATSRNDVLDTWPRIQDYCRLKSRNLDQKSVFKDQQPFWDLGILLWDGWRLHGLGLWHAIVYWKGSPSGGSILPGDYIPNDPWQAMYRWPAFLRGHVAKGKKNTPNANRGWGGRRAI
ncbi:hypothetical protein BO70DRAFT_381142 [Aspergillus heteromorphus CBS 117.55]|uniref:Uncharacterized protein n=1 Tax=Aspergillus heteromorphus CBS 117.55 TaxID=1448321 RepID=A0A317VM58_9EURO|nr:uncharacterized protein BO70DRAFT_381142 [Aspergillus heteromorphus CBS 117.55]PWY75436.1 hypothetical protein BO70DRAFT_381142 [Aspergillus heteromorphus CBS 117.55]